MRIKPVVGVSYAKTSNRNRSQYKTFFSLLRKKVDMVLLPVENYIRKEEIESKVSKCSLFLDYATYEPYTQIGIELVKTIEHFGVKVINPTKSFYYQEDKWMFYLHCLRHRIPTPETYLLSGEATENIKFLEGILAKGKLVLKAVDSDKGLCVEKVHNLRRVIQVIRKLREKTDSALIAQRFLGGHKECWRVTVIGDKVVQGVVKKGGSWKVSGARHKKIELFSVPQELKNLAVKVSKAMEMPWCGIDLIEHDGKWQVLEVNGRPSMSMILSDRKRVLNELVNYLYREAELCR